jgi:hypothetical protein
VTAGGSGSSNSSSNKMLPNLPPGVANVMPQYMMGGAGAGGSIEPVIFNFLYTYHF